MKKLLRGCLFILVGLAISIGVPLSSGVAIASSHCRVTHPDSGSVSDEQARNVIIDTMLDTVKVALLLPKSLDDETLALGFDGNDPTSFVSRFENFVSNRQQISLSPLGFEGENMLMDPIVIEDRDFRFTQNAMMMGRPVETRLEIDRDGQIIKTNLFKGKIITSDGQVEEDSLIAFYVRPDISFNDGSGPVDLPGFISGVIVRNIGNVDTERWLFFEPIRPLLRPIAQPVRFNSIFGNPHFPITRENIDRCFNNFTHVRYNPKRVPGPFSFRLTNDSQISPSASDRNKMTAENLKGKNISLVAVADRAFASLYKNVIREKFWWEGQEEVLLLVHAFYEKTIDINLQLRSMELWEADPINPGASGPGATPVDSGSIHGDLSAEVGGLINDSIMNGSSTLTKDGDMDINALQLLCDFAQGVMIENTSLQAASVIPLDGATNHLVSSSGINMIAHLFSGYDFASSLSGDGGGILCEGGGCGGTEDSSPMEVGDVLGMAEGLGGFDSNSASPCTNLANESMMNNGSIFLSPGHHSVSQHAPERIFCAASSPCPSILNNQYQATLFQRFLIVSHEIGHNLGFEHAGIDSNSVMQSPLNKDIQFRLFD